MDLLPEGQDGKDLLRFWYRDRRDGDRKKVASLPPDELGLSWTVNWSDASGERWKGQLIEIKNPPCAARGKKALTFMYAETWGKAVYR